MSERLPKEILQAGESAGGSLLDGMIRFLPPEELEPILREGYRCRDTAVPFAITAFGDILIWEKDQYICKVSFRHATAEVLTSGADYFFGDLAEDRRYAEKIFEMSLFAKAKERLGGLSGSECYGFVPLERLGGPADPEHLQKVQYKEYLLLLIRLGGGIDLL